MARGIVPAQAKDQFARGRGSGRMVQVDGLRLPDTDQSDFEKCDGEGEEDEIRKVDVWEERRARDVRLRFGERLPLEPKAVAGLNEPPSGQSSSATS